MVPNPVRPQLTDADIMGAGTLRTILRKGKIKLLKASSPAVRSE